MASITFEAVSKRFDDVVAVDHLDLAVADGELLMLLGPSGCGKTTALRMVAGLEEPTSAGSVIGPYADVRVDVSNAEESMYAGNATPSAALKQARSAVNATLSSYDRRLGG
jgi:ABC-type sulfate/molybdate transport systems ATPase subunit